MKRIYLIIISLGFLISVSCAGTQKTSESENYKELKFLVESRKFEIENDFINSTFASNINLIGNPNKIEFIGDSLDIFLPFFGTRSAGGNYGREGAISFEGIPQDFEIREEKDRILIEFNVSQDTENLQFYIILYSNKKTNTTVYSSQRSTITYLGELSKLEEGMN